MPRKAATNGTPTGKRTINKSKWIREQKASLSAKEVVEKGKSEGIKLSLAQVYTARSTGKKSAAAAVVAGAPVKRGPGRPSNASKAAAAAAAAAARRGSAAGRGSAPKIPTPATADLTSAWFALTMKIGTANARQLLEKVEEMQPSAG